MEEPLIYFVRWSNLCKIGFTTNLELRMQSLRDNVAWSGETLTVLHTIKPGDLTMEAEIHKHFDDLRVQLESHREWFYLREALKEYLESQGCDCEDFRFYEPSLNEYWISREAPQIVLCKLMIEKKITRSKLACVLNCSWTSLDLVLSGEQQLTATQIDASARLFNVPHARFFGS